MTLDEYLKMSSAIGKIYPKIVPNPNANFFKIGLVIINVGKGDAL